MNIIISLTASYFIRQMRLLFRPRLLLFYAERIPVALPTDSVNAFESEIVDAGLKSRRRLIQSGMVIACVARGQPSGGCSEQTERGGVGRLHPRNARGDSEFIPGKDARALPFARLSAYLNQPRVSTASIEHANPLPLCACSLRKRITFVRCQRKSLSGKERQRMRRKRLQRLMIITVGFDHFWFLYP